MAFYEMLVWLLMNRKSLAIWIPVLLTAFVIIFVPDAINGLMLMRLKQEYGQWISAAAILIFFAIIVQVVLKIKQKIDSFRLNKKYDDRKKQHIKNLSESDYNALAVFSEQDGRVKDIADIPFPDYRIEELAKKGLINKLGLSKSYELHKTLKKHLKDKFNNVRLL